MSADQSASLSPEKLAAIRSLFQELPNDFEGRHQTLKEIRDAFHEQLARSFEEALNQYAGRLSQESPAEKARAASIINGILRSVGLTIRDPTSGKPAILVVDNLGKKRPGIARIRFSVQDEEGAEKRTFTGEYIPELTLMQNHPRRKFWERRLREHVQPQR